MRHPPWPIRLEQIEGLLESFDRQLLAQQRLVDRIGFLSPAIIVNEAMSSIAGNGSHRYLSFKKQVETFHNEWRAYFYPKTMDGRAMALEDLESLPLVALGRIPRTPDRAGRVVANCDYAPTCVRGRRNR